MTEFALQLADLTLGALMVWLCLATLGAAAWVSLVAAAACWCAIRDFWKGRA